MNKNNNGPVYAAALVVCVLIVVLGAVFSATWKTSPVTTTVPQGGNLSKISVSASGSAKGIPSMATVDLFINATGNSTGAATSSFSSRLAEFNKTVYSYIGGNTSLVKTDYYNVGPVCSIGSVVMPVYEGQPCNNSTAKIVYEAQESLTVTLPQVGRLNGFLVNITVVPGLQVQDVGAVLSDFQITQLRQQALQLAIANATFQAKAVIGNATIVNSNVSVGGYTAYPFPVYAASSGGEALAPATSPLYYNGTSSVYENIQATFYYRK